MTTVKPGRRLWFWWLVFGFLVFSAIYLLGHIGRSVRLEPVQPGYYRVLKFDDGDTITVDMNGAAETVRFIGVDTPETHHPKFPVQCYGREAADYTRRLIGGQPVRLQADPLDTNRDRYGRLLRYVYLPDSTLVNKDLISRGYGFAYTYFPFTKQVEFKLAELKAHHAKVGLWLNCKVITLPGGHKTAPVAQ